MTNIDANNYKIEKQIENINLLKISNQNTVEKLKFENAFYDNALKFVYKDYQSKQGFIEHYKHYYKRVGAYITTAGFTSAFIMFNASMTLTPSTAIFSIIPGLTGVGIMLTSKNLAKVKFDKTLKGSVDYIERKLNKNNEEIDYSLSQIDKYKNMEYTLKSKINTLGNVNNILFNQDKQLVRTLKR